MDYVPAAVAYVDDDLDLPLPDPDFAQRIQALATAPAAPRTRCSRPLEPLPERKIARTAGAPGLRPLVQGAGMGACTA
jgi:hypothetical protein